MLSLTEGPTLGGKNVISINFLLFSSSLSSPIVSLSFSFSLLPLSGPHNPLSLSPTHCHRWKS
ncbi:hypothetical protein RchiOBHm_Chr7g0225601 [Rosa chinensis]|uniref:Uncharacterized protein n=1 Tax=Rosa chinensis TaxID=74649 RepID=A0A2P6PE52_ROSCH|nr:hypothetical protein RchiOBHm_Chr7g0225601 [Rosa chinensis]